LKLLIREHWKVHAGSSWRNIWKNMKNKEKSSFEFYTHKHILTTTQVNYEEWIGIRQFFLCLWNRILT
jgi:hypothetical protein